MARKQKGVWDISIEINGAEVKNNLKDVGAAVGKLRGQLSRLQPGTDEFIKKTAELKKAKERYKEIKDEINDTNTSLEEAQGHFSNLFSGLLTGDIKAIQSGLQGISGNIKGMTKAALAFIATPIGLAITVLASIGVATKKWFDFNVQVFETNKLVKELTNETGQAVDAIRIRAEVLRDTFEIDLTESIKSAKTLVNGFGISYDEAFNLIEDSAVRGKHKNQEFFDSLKEYPVQFKNAGFSAKEFINIVNTGADLSIYSDKLPDALKEFTLAITEQTDAGREALINAFGKEFTDRLFTDLKNGAITPKDALKSIALEAENIGLNSQQAQLLTADLFKGAGEDAGGALKIFEAVNIALNDQQKPLTENQVLTAKQLELNKELQGVYTQLFASGNSAFQNLIAKGKIFATETLLKILKGGVDVYNWFIDLNNESRFFSTTMVLAKNAISTTFKFLSVAIRTAIKNFGSLGTVFKGVVTFSPKTISKGFTEGLKNIGDGLDELKEKAKSNMESIKDVILNGNTKEKISLSDFTAGETSDKTNNVNPIGSNSNNDDKELTPEDKKIIASKKKLAEFLKEFEEDQELQKELLKVDKAKRDEEEEVLRLEAKYQKMAEDAGFETILEAGLLDAKNTELKIIRDNYDALELEAKKKKDAELLKLDKKQKDALIKAETDLANAKLNAKKQGLSALQSIFGQESAIAKFAFGIQKALAIQEILINTKKANAQITSNLAIANLKSVAASPLTGGMPMVGYNTVLATKSTLTNNINSGTQIAGILASSIAGFYDGGDTGNKAMAYDNYGKITGVVHDNEWVMPKIMTQNPKYAANLAYLEKERKLITKGYFNGGSASENSNTTTSTSFDTISSTENPVNSNDAMLIQVLSKNNQFLEFLITNGVTAVFSNDLRNAKLMQEQLDDYQKLINKNIR